MGARTLVLVVGVIDFAVCVIDNIFLFLRRDIRLILRLGLRLTLFWPNISVGEGADWSTENGRCVDEEVLVLRMFLETHLPVNTGLLLEEVLEIFECGLEVFWVALVAVVGCWAVGPAELGTAHVGVGSRVGFEELGIWLADGTLFG